MVLKYLYIIILVIFFFSTCNTNKLVVNEVLIPSDLHWSKGYGNDSSVLQADTEIFATFGDYLVHGKVQLLLNEEDSISFVFEAGILQFIFKDCIKMNSSKNVYVSGGEFVYSKDNSMYNGTKYILTDNIYEDSLIDFGKRIKKDVKGCMR